MQLTAVQVQCYASQKADETPRRLFLDYQWIEITEVVDRWHQAQSLPEWPRADYFKALGANGREYLLKHDLEANLWYLVRQW